MSVQDWICSVCGVAHQNTACGGTPTFAIKEPGVVVRPSTVSRKDFDNLFESHCRLGKQRDELLLQNDELVKDGSRLADALVKSREDVLGLREQIESLGAEKDSVVRLVESIKKLCLDDCKGGLIECDMGECWPCAIMKLMEKRNDGLNLGESRGLPYPRPISDDDAKRGHHHEASERHGPNLYKCGSCGQMYESGK